MIHYIDTNSLLIAALALEAEEDLEIESFLRECPEFFQLVTDALEETFKEYFGGIK